MKCLFYENNHCRSCELLDRSYPDTLHLKEIQLQNLFPEQSHLLKPTVGLKNGASGSRSKAKFVVSTLENHLTFGFINGLREFRDLEECPLHSVGINQMLPAIKKILENYKILPLLFPTLFLVY